MTIPNVVIKAICRLYLDFIRIMPQLVLLFLMYFGVTKAFGLNLSAFASSIVVFTLWGTAELGDLVRANGSIPGEGTVKDYLKSVNYRPHATTIELYLRNCDDVDDAWEKFEKKMSERYEKRKDRAFSPEYYREAGIAHIEEDNKHDD